MTPSITESQILAAIKAFLVNVVGPGVPVDKSQANVVAEPMADNFILMTPIYRDRIATTVETWNFAATAPTALDNLQSTRMDIQLDVHGEGSSDLIQTITTTFRSPYACDFLLPLGIQPLWCDDGKQMPFINDQKQYEDRWIVEAVLQASPIVSTPQQFADTLSATLADQNEWGDLP